MAESAQLTSAPPTWVTAAEPGHWFRLSGNQPGLGLEPTPPGTRFLEDGDPALDPQLNPARTVVEGLRRWLGRRPSAPWQGRSGFPAMTEAWNSAVLATEFGASGSMVVFGGGHDDYFGSDVHAFDLASRQWSRISDGYLAASEAAYGSGAVYPDSVYPDGSPLPPHTYDYVQYDPVGNDYILFKGQTELGPDVKAVGIAHMFNLSTLAWRRSARHPVAILNSGGWTTWDPVRRLVWGHSGDAGGGNAFIAFHPDGKNEDGSYGHWGQLHASKLPGHADHNAMQIDPRRDVIVVAAHGRRALYALDPRHPGEALTHLSEAGHRPELAAYAALEFAPSMDAFVYCSAADAGAVYAVRPPEGSSWKSLVNGTWHWERLTDEGSTLNPIADAASQTAYHCNPAHTFGRMRVASFGHRDVAILVRHVDSPVYAMALD